MVDIPDLKFGPITLNYRLKSDVTSRKVKFNEMREWCWENWGPSKEMMEFDHTDLFDGVHSSNSHWCWLNDAHGRRRIYLRTDHEAELFTLRWL